MVVLSEDIDQIHHNIFGAQHPDPNMKRALPLRIVKDLLAGIRPTPCKYMHKHMMDGEINPKIWSLCETGTVEREAQIVSDRKQMCKEWEYWIIGLLSNQVKKNF